MQGTLSLEPVVLCSTCTSPTGQSLVVAALIMPCLVMPFPAELAEVKPQPVRWRVAEYNNKYSPSDELSRATAAACL